MNNKTLNWIKEVREGCKKVILLDMEKIISEFKKGNTDTIKFNSLLQEVRDNERDDALLFLIEKMLQEESKDD
jgi:predicted 2-oxoglutarate/Fe(II)-dependent dioxygenase YbiX